MSRSHAWVKRGEELIDRIPMNWGTNLTLLGAIRRSGWVVLTSQFATANKDRFVAWVKRKLLPKLRRGDVVVMDNLRAHHGRAGLPCARRSRDLSAAVLAGLQPDRIRLGAPEAVRPSHRASPPRRPAPRRSAGAPSCHPVALSQLVRSLRLSGSTQLIPGVRRPRGRRRAHRARRAASPARARHSAWRTACPRGPAGC